MVHAFFSVPSKFEVPVADEKLISTTALAERFNIPTKEMFAELL